MTLNDHSEPERRDVASGDVKPYICYVARSRSWPKIRLALTDEQKRVWEDWYDHYLNNVYSAQSSRFGRIHQFSHEYPLRSASAGGRTLEIGPGTGSHLEFEDSAKIVEYVGVELRPTFADAVAKRNPKARLVVGDCQKRLDLPDGHFDRVLAIHILEHLENLPAALVEIKRVLRPGGLFSVIIPAEGGLGYWLGRKVSVQRIFEKRYHQAYGPYIKYEHVNTAREVLAELNPLFRTVHREFYPLRLPLVDANLIIGLTLQKPAEAE